MKKLTATACSVAFLLCAGNTLAAIYTLTDSVSFGNSGLFNDYESITSSDGSVTENLTATVLDGYNRSYGSDINTLSGTGDYVIWTHNYTFEPMYSELISAELTLNLSDDRFDCFFSWEIGLTLSEDGIIDIAEIDTGEYTYDLDFTNLYDGSYQIALASVLGDFNLNSSTLTITYDSGTTPAPVPEPGTLLLLGAALGATGLTGLRRKVLKSKK